jgi:hypothetical protein
MAGEEGTEGEEIVAGRGRLEIIVHERAPPGVGTIGRG